jgi:hypothetical protein
MVKPALTSSSETMTSGGTCNKQRQDSSCESGSDDSGTNLKDVLESKKPSTRPVSPKAGGEIGGDEITRTIPEAGNMVFNFTLRHSSLRPKHLLPSEP